MLVSSYRAFPEGLKDVVMLTETENVEALRKRHPHAQVHSLFFSTEELVGDGLRIGLGLKKEQEPLYARALQSAARQVKARGERLTWAALLTEVQGAGLALVHQMTLLQRLRLLRPFIDDDAPASGWIQAGRLVLVHLHENSLSYDHAMTLVELVLHTLVLARPLEIDGEAAPKLLLAMDEKHKVADHPGVGRALEQIVRMRRHLSVSCAFATQDPQRLTAGVLENLDGIAVFQHSNAAWARTLAQVAPPLALLTPPLAAGLRAGMAALWFRQWHMIDGDVADYQGELILAHMRPRASQHGGVTQG